MFACPKVRRIPKALKLAHRLLKAFSHHPEPCDALRDLERLRPMLPLVLADVKNRRGKLAFRDREDQGAQERREGRRREGRVPRT